MNASAHLDLLAHVRDGHSPSDAEALALTNCDDLALMQTAATLRDTGHGANVSYSRKVFIPLTHLCRDTCHYCTFAKAPRRAGNAYLSPDEVLAIARAGAPPAATKRCSRSVTGRSSATAPRVRRSTGSATRRRSIISPRWRSWCSTRPGCCRISIPAS